eukprot:CAMPEP_0179043752 /NCGR_PEP_ID=MMETSP0796-20121207/17324_1 /TAXON_ID=73915 /ORGANISM="Pyrodinium bahamense, Strain pbaha01" /LENGTH=992 /DNA_ID=CAMNT_0020740137 /DNA_START=24 /DNA_END=3003 /DNA_ORIENTATION=-
MKGSPRVLLFLAGLILLPILWTCKEVCHSFPRNKALWADLRLMQPGHTMNAEINPIGSGLRRLDAPAAMLPHTTPTADLTTRQHGLDRMATPATPQKSVTIIVYESARADEVSPVDNLLRSATQAGFDPADIMVLGRGMQHLWKRTESGEIPYGIKLEAIKAFLSTIPPSRLVLVADGRDTVIQMPPAEIARRFRKAIRAASRDPQISLLFSAESACCVAPMWRHKPGMLMNFSTGRIPERMRHTGDPPPAGVRLWDKNVLQQWTDFFIREARLANASTLRFPYLNAGQFLGNAQNIIKLLELVRFDITEDDQMLFSEAMWHASAGRGELRFVLDYDQEIVSSAGWRGPDLCPFSPRQPYCTYALERQGDGRQAFRDTLTNRVPVLIHTQNKFWTCYNKLVTGLLGERGFMNKVTHRQLTTGTAATFRGGYHMLNATSMAEFQRTCPAIEGSVEASGDAQLVAMRVYSGEEVSAQRRRSMERSLWMEFWNRHAGMVYEFSSGWDEGAVRRSVSLAWELQGRPAFLQAELRRLPPGHISNGSASGEGPERHGLCEAVLAAAIAQERVRAWMNLTDVVVGKSSMLKLHEVAAGGVPHVYHELEAANNVLGGHIGKLFSLHPEHRAEEDPAELAGDGEDLASLTRPDAVLIGSDGCGAEMLGEWLSQHPEIAVPPNPIHHFSHLYRGGVMSELSRSALQGYHEMLMGNRIAPNSSLLLEVSPSYLETHWFPDLSKSLSVYAPDVKLLAVVCDPAQRALRQFQTDVDLAASQHTCSSTSDPLQPVWHEKARELQSLLREDKINGFEDLVDTMTRVDRQRDQGGQLDQKCRSRSCHYQKYFLPGLYSQHMARILREFRPEQLLVVDGASLASGDPWPQLSRVLSFLGLNPLAFPKTALARLEVPPAILPQAQRSLQQLREAYRRPNEALACSIQQDFPLRWGLATELRESLQTICSRMGSESPEVKVEDSGRSTSDEALAARLTASWHSASRVCEDA